MTSPSDLLRTGTGVVTSDNVNDLLTNDPRAGTSGRTLTLTVPTRELLLCLRDVIPFASPDPENLDLRCVQIQWDGDNDRLNFLSTDRYRSAWSSWGPDDVPDVPLDEPVGVNFGPQAPYATTAITIEVGDAKDILSTFKVNKKDGRTPLTVTLTPDGVTIHRSPETGYSEHTLKLAGTQSRFPDVRALLVKQAGLAADFPGVQSVAYTPSLLKDFTTVRPGSVLEVKFASDKLTLIKIGRYFQGSLVAATPEAE